MATSDNWGQGSKNNDNGWGKGASNNSNGWGSIHANTYGHPTTNLTGESGFVGLLDLFSGAAFATGMRLLRADYSGGLLRIIAYDGATEQGAADIMPYKIGNEYWVNLNSKLDNLDATATGRGLTTNDTLADLCSVGVNDYDGLVPSWYDQSLNANHATQTNISNMPKLVDAGVLIEENGKPAIQFDGVDDYISTGFGQEFIQPLTYFLLNQFDSKIVIIGAGGNYNLDQRILLYNSLNRFTPFAGTINLRTGYLTTAQILHTILFNGNSSIWRTNAFQRSTGYAGANSTVGISFGADVNGDSPGKVKHQSAIMYPSDVSADFTPIESNINNAYNIY